MRKLTLFTLVFAFLVIQLGAFTRLTDAGLGCPDWPGCYGFFTAPTDIPLAESRFPERPVDMAKAWAEMSHRYVAAALGLLILALAVLSIKKGEAKTLPLAILAMVGFQGALGMWTVTLNLLPLVVMGHLLGGFTVFSLLFLLWLKQQQAEGPPALEGVRPLALSALVILIIQIALGGWTSANYAALVCTQLPFCEGAWWQNWSPVTAFQPLPPPASSYEFGVLDHAARTTIHVSHRIGALLTTAVLLWLGWRLFRLGARQQAGLLLGLLAVQVSLGLANVLGSLPLPVAVAHNGVAALLLLALIWINHTAWSNVPAHLEESDAQSTAC